MMKKLIVALFLLPSLALADTFIGLNNPDSAAIGQRVVRVACAAQKFSTDGLTISGTCQFTGYSNVKYAQPPRWLYDASWNLTGAVMLGALTCTSPLHMGIDHSGCPTLVSLLDTNEVIVLDGVSFWYVTTSVNGAILLHIQTGSLVYLP